MEINLLINWDRKEMIDKKKLKAHKAQLLEEMLDTSNSYFKEWLIDNYDVEQIWEWNEDDKIKIMDEYAGYAALYVDKHFALSNYETLEFNLEI